MKGKFPVERFQTLRTPFYYYDTELLRQTLRAITAETSRHEGWHVHYAIKANANPKLLTIIREADKQRALQSLSDTLFNKQ